MTKVKKLLNLIREMGGSGGGGHGGGGAVGHAGGRLGHPSGRKGKGILDIGIGGWWGPYGCGPGYQYNVETGKCEKT